MSELTEERVREIAREEILKREMEKIRTISRVNELADKITEDKNEEELKGDTSAP